MKAFCRCHFAKHASAVMSVGLLVQGDYLAGFTPVTDSPSHNCGLQRLDHAVGNVNNLIEALDYVSGFTGFHE